MEEELEEQEEDIWLKVFSSCPSFKQDRDYNSNCFNDEPRYHGVFLRNNLPRRKDASYIGN